MRFIYILIVFAVLNVSAFGQNSLCSGQAPITITTSGTTTVIVADAARNIHVCKVTFALSAASDITFVATNGGGNTNISGVYKGVQTLALDFTGDLKTGLANGFGINSSAVITGGGVMTFYVTPN